MSIKSTSIEQFDMISRSSQYYSVMSALWGVYFGLSCVSHLTVVIVYLFQFSAKVLELARKQRMNTEVRRNIFCVIMTSEDYMDAFEKLLRFVMLCIDFIWTKNRRKEIWHAYFGCISFQSSPSWKVDILMPFYLLCM